MRTLTLPYNGWKPRWYQRDAWRAFRNPDIKTIVLAWARRHGKDETALHATAIKAMERVANYYHCLPEYGQARKALWEARNPHTGTVRWKEVFPPELISHVDNQTMMLTLKNGSTWQLIGSDNSDSLMGASPAGIVFSEAALANATTFAFFRPILLENNGWSAHISSTRGKNHFYRLFNALQNSKSSFTSHISALDTDVFDREALREEERIYIEHHGAAIGRSLFRQEYLSSWDAAIVGAVWGEELTQLETEGRALPLWYDPRFPVHTSWDLGVGDETVILFWQTVGNSERLIDWYASANTGLGHFVEILNSKPYVYSHHIGPHDIEVREWGANGVSRKSQAKRLGVKFETAPRLPKQTSIALVSSLLNRVEINVKEVLVTDPSLDCRFILEALKQYRFRYDSERKIMSKDPVHDWTSHYADALATKAIYSAGDLATALPGDGVLDVDKTFNGTRLRQILRSRAGRQTGAWG